MNSNAARPLFDDLGPSEMLREILRMHEADNPLDARMHHGDGDEALTPSGETLDEMRRRLVTA